MCALIARLGAWNKHVSLTMVSNWRAKEMSASMETEQNTEQDSANNAEKGEKLCRFPLSRVKTIMKLDPDVVLASQEAVFLVSKATEMFVAALAKEAYTYTRQAKKKTIQKKDVESSVEAVEAFAFLEGTLD
ncbi:DNA polymerase epsilon subunit 4-like [Dermacentor silvarum]|uniref:DNA polymerase epsilon subunit 4-like n=1 Tax=Dermacentor silvarum TaxID=543639 RepID=UPI0018973B02|nr:DNA polymerase epsilon subunit 4-like [Dermacentor silvarum]